MVLSSNGRPDWTQGIDGCDEVFLDLRRYLRHGLEPLPEIESVLKELRPCQIFHMKTEKEPILLYPLFYRMGLERYTQGSDNGWDVYLRNTSAAKA